MFSRQPNCYRTILRELCVFKLDVAIDVPFVRGQNILHAVCSNVYAVCKQTHILGEPIEKQQYYTLRETFMYILAIPYLGMSHNLWVKSG